MTTATKQFHTQPAGSVVDYGVNSNATVTQITVGSRNGRVSGVIKIRYRPVLDLKVDVERSDFERTADSEIDFAPDNQGAVSHTYVLDGIRASIIEVSDSGNGSLGDFWIHITQN
jgi:hypothetical protein